MSACVLVCHHKQVNISHMRYHFEIPDKQTTTAPPSSLYKASNRHARNELLRNARFKVQYFNKQNNIFK